MEREQIIEELKELAKVFAEVYHCVPVCLTEAILLLERDGMAGAVYTDTFVEMIKR